MEIILLIVIVLIIWKYLPKENQKNIKRNIVNTTEQSAALVNSSYIKAKKSIEKTISKSYITNCSWILTNEMDDDILYTFLNNNELLITKNGFVKRANYELIIDNNSILITADGITQHYNLINMRNDYLLLNKVSSNEILFFANQTKFKDELKAIVYKNARELYYDEN